MVTRNGRSILTGLNKSESRTTMGTVHSVVADMESSARHYILTHGPMLTRWPGLRLWPRRMQTDEDAGNSLSLCPSRMSNWSLMFCCFVQRAIVTQSVWSKEYGDPILEPAMMERIEMA